MKKTGFITVLTVLVTLLATSVISCSKKVTDENGCYTDGKSAMEAAKKANNNILIVATMDGDDLFSADLINNVFKDSNFKKEICSEYTVLAMDFSKSSYEATAINEESTKKEIELANEKADKMQQNTFLASRLNLDLTPAIYIMTKDMYFITKVDYLTDQIVNYQSFKEMIESQKEIVNEFTAKVEKTENGTSAEKLAAIDEIYEGTEAFYRTFLIDLIKEYIDIDKKDESGLLGKYLLAKADIDSSNYFMVGDLPNAVKVYADTAEDVRLTPEYRQNAYYSAAYILLWGNSTDYNGIKDYFKKAINAYPEGPNSSFIQKAIDQIDQILSTQVVQPQ